MECQTRRERRRQSLAATQGRTRQPDHQECRRADEVRAWNCKRMVVPEGGEFRLCNTICEPTSERQNALKRLIDRDHCDVVFAIGGRKSSNTARLAEVASHMGVRVTTSSGPKTSRPNGSRAKPRSASPLARPRRIRSSRTWWTPSPITVCSRLRRHPRRRSRLRSGLLAPCGR